MFSESDQESQDSFPKIPAPSAAGMCLRLSRLGLARRLPSSSVILSEQTLEYLATGGWTEGVSDAVVLGESLHFVKAVLKVEILPAIGIADLDVERDVQAA